MLFSPIVHSQVRKWMLALTEFSLHYVTAKIVKGQMLTNFLVSHPCIEVEEANIVLAKLKPLKLYFDGSRHKKEVSRCIFILSPSKEPTKFMFELKLACS